MERMTDYKPKEWQDLEELYRKQNVRINELEQENKKLRDLKCVPSNLKTLIRIDKENERLEEENKKLKEEIKEIEKNQEYRYHRCMVAERGGEDED